MSEVIQNLGRLEWWVNTIIIALIVSVIAGFLRDLIPAWLSGLSSWFRRRSRKNKKQIVIQAKLLLEDVHLYIGYVFNAIIGLITTIATLMVAYLFGPIHLFYETYPQYDAIRLLWNMPRLGQVAVSVIALFLLILIFPTLFNQGRRRKVLARVNKVARRRAKLKRRDRYVA